MGLVVEPTGKRVLRYTRSAVAPGRACRHRDALRADMSGWLSPGQRRSVTLGPTAHQQHHQPPDPLYSHHSAAAVYTPPVVPQRPQPAVHTIDLTQQTQNPIVSDHPASSNSPHILDMTAEPEPEPQITRRIHTIDMTAGYLEQQPSSPTRSDQSVQVEVLPTLTSSSSNTAVLAQPISKGDRVFTANELELSHARDSWRMVAAALLWVGTLFLVGLLSVLQVGDFTSVKGDPQSIMRLVNAITAAASAANNASNVSVVHGAVVPCEGLTACHGYCTDVLECTYGEILTETMYIETLFDWQNLVFTVVIFFFMLLSKWIFFKQYEVAIALSGGAGPRTEKFAAIWKASLESPAMLISFSAFVFASASIYAAAISEFSPSLGVALDYVGFESAFELDPTVEHWYQNTGTAAYFAASAVPRYLYVTVLRYLGQAVSPSPPRSSSPLALCVGTGFPQGSATGSRQSVHAWPGS